MSIFKLLNQTQEILIDSIKDEGVYKLMNFYENHIVLEQENKKYSVLPKANIREFEEDVGGCNFLLPSRMHCEKLTKIPVIFEIRGKNLKHFITTNVLFKKLIRDCFIIEFTENAKMLKKFKECRIENLTPLYQRSTRRSEESAISVLNTLQLSSKDFELPSHHKNRKDIHDDGFSASRIADNFSIRCDAIHFREDEDGDLIVRVRGAN